MRERVREKEYKYAIQLFLEKPWKKNTHTQNLKIYEKNIILYYMDKSFTLQCEGTICHFTKWGFLFIVFSVASWVTIAWVDTMGGCHLLFKSWVWDDQM